MTQRTDVYFFTLIDLLLQLVFVGLVVFAVTTSESESRKTISAQEAEQLQQLLSAAGASTIQELTDELTRLGPIDKSRDLADEVARVGGIDSVKAALARLAKLERGSGLPACVYREEGGRRIGVPVMDLVATDDSIQVTKVADTVATVMRSSPKTLIGTYGFADFRRRFRPLAPGTCWYRVDLTELTDRVFAREAVSDVFQFGRARRRR